MTQRMSGLSTSESLQLEEHLERCEACREDADALSGVRALALSFDPELDADTRARAVERALRSRPQPERVSVGHSVWAGAFAGAALTAAVAIAIALQSETPAAAPRVESAESAAHEAVELVISEGERTLIEGHAFRAREQTRLQLAHATVDVSAESVVRWNAATRELSLDEGELTAEVDPSVHRSFAVVSRSFRAEVLGTRFSVTPKSVAVEHGVVRVIDSAGRVRATLRAGERYEHVEERAEAHKPAKAGKREALDGKALLREARGALARGELEPAKLAIQSALETRLGKGDRAEALTLRAELALARGDKAEARETYLEVSRRFAGLPAGENALFAAARTQPNPEAAAKLLARYLERYPEGRFVDEARRRLSHLARPE